MIAWSLPPIWSISQSFAYSADRRPIERAQTFLPGCRWRDGGRACVVRKACPDPGTLRKLLLAEALCRWRRPASTNGPRTSQLALVTWLVAFGFALYNDFAGIPASYGASASCLALSCRSASSSLTSPALQRILIGHITLSHWRAITSIFKSPALAMSRSASSRPPDHPPLAAVRPAPCGTKFPPPCCYGVCSMRST
jgi:hypothetical protein